MDCNQDESPIKFSKKRHKRMEPLPADAIMIDLTSIEAESENPICSAAPIMPEITKQGNWLSRLSVKK